MPITDHFNEYQEGLTSPIIGGFDVTPADATDLPVMTRAVMVSGAGDIAAVFKDGGTLTLSGLTPGVVYPFRIARVLATGTTASGVKGLF